MNDNTIFEAVEKFSIDSLKNALNNLKMTDQKVIMYKNRKFKCLPKKHLLEIKMKDGRSPLFHIILVQIKDHNLQNKLRGKNWYPDNWKPLTRSSLLGSYSFTVPKPRKRIKRTSDRIIERIEANRKILQRKPEPIVMDHGLDTIVEET